MRIIPFDGLGPYEGAEYFLPVWNEFSPYFLYGENHDERNFRPSGLYVYSFYPRNPMVTGKITFNSFSISGYETDITPDSNIMGNFIELYDKDGNIVGYFDQNDESLYLKDITHNTPVKAKILIEGLINMGLLHKKDKALPKITLGGDPEFELIRPSGEIGYADEECVFDDIWHGDIGADGSGAQIELRPSPADTPEEYIENVRKLFQKFIDKHPNYDLGADMIEFACGGHIHLGGVVATDDLADFLDSLIGIPSKKLERRLRLRSGYGEIGDIRRQPHGAEYRVMPATIYYNPYLLRIIYKIAQNGVKWALQQKDFELEKNEDGVAKRREYLKFITLSEYNYFRRALNRKYTGSVIKNWIKGFTPVKRRTRIVFADAWNPDIREIANEYLKKKLPKGSRVRLFGLRKERGIVFAGDGLSPQADVNVGYMAWGIPYLYRTDISHLSSFKGVLDIIISRVREAI